MSSGVKGAIARLLSAARTATLSGAHSWLRFSNALEELTGIAFGVDVKGISSVRSDLDRDNSVLLSRDWILYSDLENHLLLTKNGHFKAITPTKSSD